MPQAHDLKQALAERGFARIPDATPPDLLERFIADVRRNTARSQHEFVVNGGTMYGTRIHRTFDLVGKSPALLELLALPMIDTVMRATLLDYCDHALLSAATALEVFQEAGAKPQPFHRDEDVYPKILPRTPNGPEYTINIMVAGADFTAENGATLMIPGSHLWSRDHPRPGHDHPSEPLLMKRGDWGVWLGSIYHGAGVNLTSEPRLGIPLSFSLGWLRTIENQFMLLDLDTIAAQPLSVQRLLGYDAHGALGLHDWMSPVEALKNRSRAAA